MIRPWEIKSSRRVLDCRIFQVRHDVTINPRTGQPHDMYVLEQSNWVNIIPLTPDERVVMVEQWRHGTRTVELETPGGLMDASESPEQSARRELLEETGYAPDKVELLGTVSPNPAIQNNRQHYLLATGCRQVADLKLDHAEDIGVRLVPLAEIPDLIRTGKISHGIVIGGFYWLNDYRATR
ncbi:MAG: NUDIX hydrolase [Verrucomicrobiota bacterium]